MLKTDKKSTKVAYAEHTLLETGQGRPEDPAHVPSLPGRHVESGIRLSRIGAGDKLPRSHWSAVETAIQAHGRQALKSIGATASRKVQRSFEASAIRREALDIASVLRVQPAPTLELHLHPGMQFLAPPYDVDWGVGSGWPLARFDGEMLLFGSDGFSASGFGFFVDSPATALVSVVPHGAYQASWGSLASLPRLRSQMGTGVVIYDGQSTLVSHQPVVWDVRSPPAFTSGKVECPLADTSSPIIPGTFGPMRLAPKLFTIEAGHRCLVWFYIWHAGSGFKDAPFITVARSTIPSVTVVSGPPPVIR